MDPWLEYNMFLSVQPMLYSLKKQPISEHPETFAEKKTPDKICSCPLINNISENVVNGNENTA